MTPTPPPPHPARPPPFPPLSQRSDFATAAGYKAFKTWESAQPTYKAIKVASKTRLVAAI
jgi:hypothetical protein